MIDKDYDDFIEGYNYDPGEGCTPGLQVVFNPALGGNVMLSLWDEVGDCAEAMFPVGELFEFLRGFMGVVDG